MPPVVSCQLSFEPLANDWNSAERQDPFRSLAARQNPLEFFRWEPKKLIKSPVMFACAGVDQAVAGAAAEKPPSGGQVQLSDALQTRHAASNHGTNKPEPWPTKIAWRCSSLNRVFERNFGSFSIVSERVTKHQCRLVSTPSEDPVSDDGGFCAISIEPPIYPADAAFLPEMCLQDRNFETQTILDLYPNCPRPSSHFP